MRTIIGAAALVIAAFFVFTGTSEAGCRVGGDWSSSKPNPCDIAHNGGDRPEIGAVMTGVAPGETLRPSEDATILISCGRGHTWRVINGVAFAHVALSLEHCERGDYYGL